MAIEFFKPNEASGTTKITVHKTGKLGFSKPASDLLQLSKNKFCKVGKESNSDSIDTLFMIVSDKKDEFTYNISKAGDYYYLNAKQLLIDLGINYKDTETTIIYDIKKEKIDHMEIFKLSKRVLIKRKAK